MRKIMLRMVVGRGRPGRATRRRWPTSSYSADENPRVAGRHRTARRRPAHRQGRGLHRAGPRRARARLEDAARVDSRGGPRRADPRPADGPRCRPVRRGPVTAPLAVEQEPQPRRRGARAEGSAAHLQRQGGACSSGRASPATGAGDRLAWAIALATVVSLDGAVGLGAARAGDRRGGEGARAAQPVRGPEPQHEPGAAGQPVRARAVRRRRRPEMGAGRGARSGGCRTTMASIRRAADVAGLRRVAQVRLGQRRRLRAGRADARRGGHRRQRQPALRAERAGLAHAAGVEGAAARTRSRSWPGRAPLPSSQRMQRVREFIERRGWVLQMATARDAGRPTWRAPRCCGT